MSLASEFLTAKASLESIASADASTAPNAGTKVLIARASALAAQALAILTEHDAKGGNGRTGDQLQAADL